RPRTHLHDATVDLEVLQLLPERFRVFLELLAAALELGLRRRLEKSDRWKLELGPVLTERKRLLPREALVHERLRLRGLDDEGRRRYHVGGFGDRDFGNDCRDGRREDGSTA